MTNEIVFYDILAQKSTAKERAWSPNTFKVRYALAFKGLPFKTVWVEFPDIAGACKKIGAPPTETNPDGSPYYTLPVIQDPSTGKVVSDSWAIVEYLDNTYPDRPALLPKGTLGLQWAFTYTSMQVAIDEMLANMMFDVYKLLPPRSQDYFRVTREKFFGCKLEEISTGQKYIDQWGKTEAGFTKIKDVIKKNGEGAQFVMGDTVSFGDLFLASWLLWIRQTASGEQWEKVRGWDAGFWGKFVDSLVKYEVYDEGEVYKV
ncbi:hypothetical protein PUNSTDRAFT_120997 [Punctularia strigosozonata HHB-11173 SS5]|uniref:uncharacterized protein n=1 Tax=Punctularia strigosozonata (strain HHB-11173) TaxID=741275 RepID=UPI0004416517|nr:uncharacterized protein PUNSTDRAFT_120997 [Punctularia strigosozonata HHB-11173 SS5]EIN07717.1 hypothetical protein PUNSTDRAFT_120997 [Punctularia strigosozonata HHB-11173 SS5]